MVVLKRNSHKSHSLMIFLLSWVKTIWRIKLSPADRAVLGGVKLLSCWSLALVFFGFVLGQFCWFPGSRALEGNFQFLRPEFSLKQTNKKILQMSKCRNVFFLKQPTCLGFKNVRKGLTKQPTNSGIKIALKCSCSQQLCWGLFLNFLFLPL